MNYEKLSVHPLNFRKSNIYFEMSKDSIPEYSESISSTRDATRRLFLWNKRLIGIPLRIFCANHKFFLTRLNKQYISCFSLEFLPDKHIYLSTFAVHPNLRGQGLGYRTLDYLITHYPKYKISLDVEHDNKVAQRLYQKCNFVETKHVERYLIKKPLVTEQGQTGYSFRLAKKTDLLKLNRISNEVPNMKKLVQYYKNAFNKGKKRFYRFNYQLPVVIEDSKGNIIGIGRAIWSKYQNTPYIAASAILPEAAKAYPAFITFLFKKLRSYGISQAEWSTIEGHIPFKDSIIHLLPKPFSSNLHMVREATEH